MNLITFSKSERIANITINRPDKRNALSLELVKLLANAFKEAIEDEDVKVIVLKANGEVFSAGADLEYMQQLQHNTVVENFTDTYTLKELFLTIYQSPKLVIAQVEGHAIAGGCGLTSVCDVVFAVPEAKFGYTEVKIGFVPAIVSCFLIRKLGEGRVKELLLSGELIDAKTASNYGLVNFIVEKNDIAIAVELYAEKIVAGVSSNSITVTKQLLMSIQDLSLDEGLNLAIGLNVQTRSSNDCKKGIAAFLNKTKLDW
jgi:methylglutaconyl-CoA hydratase